MHDLERGKVTSCGWPHKFLCIDSGTSYSKVSPNWIQRGHYPHAYLENFLMIFKQCSDGTVLFAFRT